ncbi:hypothetical protein [Georgenia subflava]|uniref:Uncharacterized protein n=1 Tax=Georgenia subflava TaxID=1622177 RepID=A0A6N7EEA3_9MICO|nr:hypothetical protein [Georgenia subflava]MPV35661.1 hypothetical protein [Georgenia subflava]
MAQAGSTDSGLAVESVIRHVSSLLKGRNTIDAELAEIIGRPPLTGHLGEWLAGQLFKIELHRSATNRGWDGVFTGPEDLAGRTVNVKWYVKDEGLLDIAAKDGPDIYLVFTGPRGPATSSRGGVRPLTLESVYLFDAVELVHNQLARGAKLGIASSVPRPTWEAARIYPGTASSILSLTDKQRRLLELFQGDPR